MPPEQDAIDIAIEVGRKILLHAEGSPAKTVACGVAAAVAVVGITVGYGGYLRLKRIIG